MPHDPLTQLLRQAFGSALRQDPELIRRYSARQESRRRFLKNTALAAGSLLLPPVLSFATPTATEATFSEFPTVSPDTPDTTLQSPGNSGTENVVIVGAGIAGLNAAWQLHKQGIASTVYEASGRVGGRMYTLSNRFGPGITTDVGGEFVDTTHQDILQLLKELQLEYYDLRTDNLAPKTFWFEGQMRGEKELREAIQPFAERLMQDIHSLPEVICYKAADSFRHLDQQSILEYLQAIGVKGWLLRFLDIVLTREYGMEASEQSALNFLIMFEPPTPADKDYELFGQDHEVFKIKGGSQRLTDALYGQLKDQVLLRHRLTAITQHKTAGYNLHFEAPAEGNAKKTDAKTIIHADHVILTIPFTILRSIDLQIPLPEQKRKCIREIGYGNSCKFILGMTDKAWRHAGRQGYTFTDLSFGCGWDSSQLQSDRQGSFTVFGGGNFAQHIKDSQEEELTRSFLPALDRIYPGAAKDHTGQRLKFCWAGHPYSRAGYSAFKKGQWSTLAGWEVVPVGNIHFAGEHVSREFQGYMNGAAQTAAAAATAVATAIRGTIRSQRLMSHEMAAPRSPGSFTPQME